MTDNILAFDYNGVKVLRDSNTELLTMQGSGPTAGTLTVNDIRDGTKYQVPTGKKAHIIFLEALDLSQEIIFADDEDGTTNAVDVLDADATITNLLFISVEIPADKFINITDAGASAPYRFEIVEENA